MEGINAGEGPLDPALGELGIDPLSCPTASVIIIVADVRVYSRELYAGGIKVIRHGMTRDWVAGLKLVTGTGELLDLNRGLVKNNAGYDLRQLVIGAEQAFDTHLPVVTHGHTLVAAIAALPKA